MLIASAGLASAAPPKATAPVDIRLSTLDTLEAGVPCRVQIEATPRVDAPELRLHWVLPAGVLLSGASSSSSSGPARSGEPLRLITSIVLPDLEPRILIGGAVLIQASGARQVKAAELVVPPGSRAKQSPSPDPTRNSRGELLLEHRVTPAAR